MVRENSIKVSDEEKKLIEEVRQTEFGTDSVPFGEAIQVACENYLGEMRLDAADLDE